MAGDLSSSSSLDLPSSSFFFSSGADTPFVFPLSIALAAAAAAAGGEAKLLGTRPGPPDLDDNGDSRSIDDDLRGLPRLLFFSSASVADAFLFLPPPVVLVFFPPFFLVRLPRLLPPAPLLAAAPLSPWAAPDVTAAAWASAASARAASWSAPSPLIRRFVFFELELELFRPPPVP